MMKKKLDNDLFHYFIQHIDTLKASLPLLKNLTIYGNSIGSKLILVAIAKIMKMKAHAIMISLSYQGHLNPFVDLAMKLASKGITVTLVLTDHTRHQILAAANSSGDPDIFAEARASGLDVRDTSISDGFPLDFDRHLNVVEFWESLLADFPSIVADFVGDLIASSDPSSPPPFLVADTFAAWPSMVADKYKLVNVSFWTQPATVFSIDYHRHLLAQNGHHPPKDNEEHVIDYIPGVDPISTKDLMQHLQGTDTTTVVHKIVFGAFEEVVKADFILHNTVQELEPRALSTLNQKQPTYAVGPIKFSIKTTIPKSLLHEVDCSEWLDSRPRDSVLYVSFGSMSQTSKEIVEEIARGLVLSEVNFIWVLRPQTVSSVGGDDDGGGVLPFGFENDVVGKGLIVPWCDQIRVLSNPAVGGFLTHCGWNSTIESMWCGVPMICYPITYDQPTNRKLVVDDWKVGINLCDGGCVSRGEVAEKVKKLMVSGETSEGIRNSMQKMRSKLRKVWDKEDGSSERNFDQFLKDLNDKL